MRSYTQVLDHIGLTKPFRTLLALFALAVAMILWRLYAGLGATTGLNDGYPWGIWITYDVVTGTALACGGYAVAILVYVMNKGQYHPLVRPAILTSALGYSLAGFSVILDLGRYWNVYRIVNIWNWNLNSVLLEVAVCIMAYVVVLWIELSPAFFERWKDSPHTRLRNFSRSITPILNKALLWIIALGLLLPTMHQSSLGSLMLIAVQKLHKLWHTPMLPLLFLISCIGMGYSIVVFESILSSRHFRRPVEKRMLASLSTAIVVVLFLYVALRIADIVWRGRLNLILAFDRYSVLFLIEMALFLIPAFMLLSKKMRHDSGRLFQAAMLIILAGGLYRFSVFWVAFNPGPGWEYFPAVPEIIVTLGLIAFEIIAYVLIVKQFPAIAGVYTPKQVDRATATSGRPQVATLGGKL